MAEHRSPAKPALRFDKVAKGLVERVRAAVEDAVPDDATVVFTVTAPIRQPSKTAAALEERILHALARPGRGKLDETIYGNRVRIAIVTDRTGTGKTIGLVHNPGPTLEALLDAALRVSKVRARTR